MKLLEANGRLAIHLTVDEINSIIKTHLLNQGYASESEVGYAMVIRPHELDADLTGAYIPVDPQEWTAENCPLIREQTTKHPFWGKPEIYPDGSCLGYGCGPNDDEPHELCKKCSIYAGKEEETA